MNTEQTAPRVHHPYSPSKLQCLEACPCYESQHSENEASQMGTKQHDVVESGIDDESIPDYRAMAVADCMRFAEERIALYPGGKVLREEYLPIDDEEIQEWTVPDEPFAIASFKNFLGTTAGYLDVGIVSADELEAEIIDWKFGANAVEEASNNLQGMGYVLGMLKRFPKLKSVRVWFFLPHRDEISEHTFTRDDFAPMYLRIRTIVSRAYRARQRRDFETANPTVGTCLFCANLGRCPAVANIVIKLGKKYEPLSIPDNITPSLLFDPKEVGTGIKLAQVVKTWAEAYRTQATAKTITERDFIPEGYVLVRTQKRKVVKARQLADTAKQFLPSDKWEAVETLFDLPITPLEKLISTAAKRGSKEETVKAFSNAALANGALEKGEPYAFLRQSKGTDNEALVVDE